MARSILDIVIKLSREGKADQETIKGLVQVKNAIMDAAAITGALVSAGYLLNKAWQQTGEVAVELANKVREVQQVSGLSAEESSKLIQITDDLKVSQEDLLKIMQKNGDQYDYSINGLAGMSDQYLALGSSQEKAAFMQERFGKSWGSFVELMEQGSKRITAAGNDINKALILDQKALDQAREYERNVDNLQDTMLAYKVTVGNGLLPVLNDMFTVENRTMALMEEGLNPYEARRKAAQELSAATDELTTSETAHNAAVQAQQIEYEKVIDILGKINKAQTDYSEAVKTVNADMTLSDSERIAKLGELRSEYNKTALEVVSANMLQLLSVDGLTQAEFARYVAFQEGTGQMSANAAQQALDLNQLAMAAAEGRMSVEDLKASIAGMQDRTVTVNVLTNYGTYGVDQIKGPKQGRAYGGPVEAGKMYQVNERGIPELLNMGDQQFLMMPQGGSGYVSPMGAAGGTGGGGGGVFVNVTINSMVNTADRERMKAELLPAIVDGVRSMQAQGILK